MKRTFTIIIVAIAVSLPFAGSVMAGGPPPTSVPEVGTTALLLALSALGLSGLRKLMR